MTLEEADGTLRPAPPAAQEWDYRTVIVPTLQGGRRIYNRAYRIGKEWVYRFSHQERPAAKESA